VAAFIVIPSSGLLLLPVKVTPWPTLKVTASAATPLKLLLPVNTTEPCLVSTDKRTTFCDWLIVIESAVRVLDHTFVEPIIYYFKKFFKVFLYSKGIVVCKKELLTFAYPLATNVMSLAATLNVIKLTILLITSLGSNVNL